MLKIHEFIDQPTYLISDINECDDPSLNSCDPEDGMCEDIAGGYTCSCKTGYTGNGIQCYGRFSISVHQRLFDEYSTNENSYRVTSNHFVGLNSGKMISIKCF